MVTLRSASEGDRDVPTGTMLGYTDLVPGEPNSVDRFTGFTLGGKYYLEEVIAQGGMGVVVAARHLILGERVAIKLLRPSLFDRDESARRVLREAQAMARLRSQNIARILDAGEGPGGAPYLVMELLAGEDLGATLKRRGALPAHEVCDLIEQVCAGLHEAHGAGVIHRDLKPSNLFLAVQPDGTSLVKVLDFGISKITGISGEATLTTPDALLGSPPYMSPEQLRAPHAVDARSDIWSLGAILFRLLTGDHAYGSTSSHDMIVAISRDEPRRLRAVSRDASAALEAIVTKCMQRDPSARYATVKLLAAELRAFREGRFSDLASASHSSQPALSGPRSLSMRPASRRRMALLASVLVLSLLAITVFGFAGGHSRVSSGKQNATASDPIGARETGPTLESSSESGDELRPAASTTPPSSKPSFAEEATIPSHSATPLRRPAGRTSSDSYEDRL